MKSIGHLELLHMTRNCLLTPNTLSGDKLSWSLCLPILCCKLLNTFCLQWKGICSTGLSSSKKEKLGLQFTAPTPLTPGKRFMCYLLSWGLKKIKQFLPSSSSFSRSILDTLVFCDLMSASLSFNSLNSAMASFLWLCASFNSFCCEAIFSLASWRT